MGGGNLNLKKSWHPSTLKNQERVWKAQQQDDSEKKKLEELRKELQAQREKEEFQSMADRASGSTESNTKLDWMYKGVTALVDREAYLLGRKIDKTFDVIKAAEEANEKGQQGEQKSEGLPSQLFKKSQTDADFVPVDMAIKVREDPLYLIKKQEYESKKELLSNPIKMKMLQEMISKEKSKKHKKKKKKRKKESKRSASSDSDSSSKADAQPSGHRQRERSRSSEKRKRDSPQRNRERSSSPHSRQDKLSSKKEHRSHRSPPRHRHSQRDRSRSPQRERYNDRYREDNDNQRQARHEQDRRDSNNQPDRSAKNRSPEPRRTRRSPESSTKSRRRNEASPESKRSPSVKPGYGLIRVKETNEDTGFAKRDYRLMLEERRQKEEKERRELKERLKNRTTQKLTAEEREARLREMQHDAVIREKQREEYVSRHTKGDAVAIEDYREGGFRGAEMLSKAIDKSSVESRIKSNLKGLKSASRAMDSNFLRK